MWNYEQKISPKIWRDLNDMFYFSLFKIMNQEKRFDVHLVSVLLTLNILALHSANLCLEPCQASITDRSSHRRFSVKKGVLKNFAKFTGKHLCQILFFNKVAGLRFKKENLAQVFSYEFCEISKSTFFIEHFQTTSSKWSLFVKLVNTF